MSHETPKSMSLNPLIHLTHFTPTLNSPTHLLPRDKTTHIFTMQPLELTLIVAATRNMGIGAHGTMPWQGLRKEMQYFARVTTRLPPQVSNPTILHPILNPPY